MNIDWIGFTEYKIWTKVRTHCYEVILLIRFRQTETQTRLQMQKAPPEGIPKPDIVRVGVYSNHTPLDETHLKAGATAELPKLHWHVNRPQDDDGDITVVVSEEEHHSLGPKHRVEWRRLGTTYIALTGSPDLIEIRSIGRPTNSGEAYRLKETQSLIPEEQKRFEHPKVWVYRGYNDDFWYSRDGVTNWQEFPLSLEFPKEPDGWDYILSRTR